MKVREQISSSQVFPNEILMGSALTYYVYGYVAVIYEISQYQLLPATNPKFKYCSRNSKSAAY